MANDDDDDDDDDEQVSPAVIWQQHTSPFLPPRWCYTGMRAVQYTVAHCCTSCTKKKNKFYCISCASWATGTIRPAGTRGGGCSHKTGTACYIVALCQGFDSNEMQLDIDYMWQEYSWRCIKLSLWKLQLYYGPALELCIVDHYYFSTLVLCRSTQQLDDTDIIDRCRTRR